MWHFGTGGMRSGRPKAPTLSAHEKIGPELVGADRGRAFCLLTKLSADTMTMRPTVAHLSASTGRAISITVSSSVWVRGLVEAIATAGAATASAMEAEEDIPAVADMQQTIESSSTKRLCTPTTQEWCIRAATAGRHYQNRSN